MYLVSFVTKEVNFLKVIEEFKAVSLVPALGENLVDAKMRRLIQIHGNCSKSLMIRKINAFLTSKLICPPIENVRLR